jgi:1-aminocyclopropane-1-carboxylate deaminase
MQAIDYSLISIDPVELPLAKEQEVSLYVLRLDKVHPVISGNKIFKLGDYLEEAIAAGKTHIITFGGAWSNHIVATAAACKMLGLKCTGYIRGEEPKNWSATLREAADYGMQFKFIDRETYRLEKRNFITGNDDIYVIPEGGYGVPGALGASAILNSCHDAHFSHICCAAGTGTMAAGLALNTKPGEHVIAVSALKNNIQLEDDIRSLTGDMAPLPVLLHDYHFGGFAKYDSGLISFMNQLYTSTGIPTDFVYTGKLFFAVNDLVQQNYFPAGSRVLIIHSGGLQGNSSLSKGTLIF